MCIEYIYICLAYGILKSLTHITAHLLLVEYGASVSIYELCNFFACFIFFLSLSQCVSVRCCAARLGPGAVLLFFLARRASLKKTVR